MKKITLLTITTLLLLLNCSNSNNELEGEFKCNYSGLTNIVFTDSSYANFIILNEMGIFVVAEFNYSISDNVITFEREYGLQEKEYFFFKVDKDKLYGLYDLEGGECIKQ